MVSNWGIEHNLLDEIVKKDKISGQVILCAFLNIKELSSKIAHVKIDLCQSPFSEL